MQKQHKTVVDKRKNYGYTLYRADRCSANSKDDRKKGRNSYMAEGNFEKDFIIDKRVSFNRKIAYDMTLKAWAETQKDEKGRKISFNAYVRGLIEADMKAKRSETAEKL